VSNYAADDTQAIARRLKELEAARDEARKGTSAPVDGQESKTEEQPTGYGYGGMCYSLAHPEWPYAGTGFEWRRFVRS
jgi:hypothetical protein